MRRCFGVGMILFLLGMMAIPGFSAEKITQGEFAMLLVRVLGMEGELPPAATVEDYCDLLSSLGMEPADGWDADLPLTLGDISDILDIYIRGAKGEQLTLEKVLKILEDWSAEMPAYVPEVVPVSTVSPTF